VDGEEEIKENSYRQDETCLSKNIGYVSIV